MANSVQKKIKFSKGQISPNLIERTDLDMYNSSAQKMENVVSTIYGGVKTRRGTSFVDDVVCILSRFLFITGSGSDRCRVG